MRQVSRTSALRREIIGLVVMILLGFSLACGGTAEPDSPMIAPETNNPSASCSSVCGEGTICQNGVCVVANSPPEVNMMTPVVGGEVGAACDSNGDCGDALCLQDESIPGGYCSKVCATGIPGADDRCPAGALCTPTEDAASICLRSCVDASECRQGYICAFDGLERGVCLPACTTDLDCPLDSVCDASSGFCVADDSGAARLGSSCGLDADCASQFCFDETTTDWPGGACVDDCTGRFSGDYCDGAGPESGLCVEIDMDLAVCFPSCSTGNDCREDYACSADVGATNDDGFGFCLPSCGVLGCGAGEYCDVTGFCEPEVGVDDQVVMTTDLGVLSVASDRFEIVEFEIPQGALSFAITMQADRDTAPIVNAMRGPTGDAIYDYDDPLSSKMKVSDGYGPLTSFIYPNAPALNLTPGTYAIELASFDSANVSVQLHVKMGSTPRVQTVPLTLWFTFNSFVDAQTAQADPAIQSAVAKMQAIYASAGVDLFPITYLDAAEPALTDYSFPLLDETPAEQVIADVLGTQPPGGAHMVLVDTLFSDGGDGLYGISGGLPGPVSVNGSDTLGVLVSLSTHTSAEGALDGVELGATMAHELGHYFGLFHISEANGTAHDPLTDTPECNVSSDFDGNGLLSGDECGASAATNMMFWTSAEGFTQDQISREQEWVLLRNPTMLP